MRCGTLAVFIACLHAQTPSAPPTQLLISQRVERALEPGATHTYEIHTAAGQYVKATVEQRGIDVAVRTYANNTSNSIESDSELRLAGTETVEFVAAAPGTLRLNVESKYKAFPAGRYVIQLVEIRAATDKDRSLDSARHAFAESLRLRAAGKYADAQTLASEVLATREHQLGAEHAEVAAVLVHLARLASDQGDYDRSVQLAERCVRIRESTLPAGHPLTAQALDVLANAYARQEEFNKAIPLHERALSIYENALGKDHPTVAVVLINVGVEYKSKGDVLKAEQTYLRALAIQERTVGPEHRNVGVLANNLAVLYLSKGEYTRSAAMALRALAVFEKRSGAEHPSLRDPLMNVANAYCSYRRYADAEAAYERALRITEHGLGPSNPATALVLNDFAGCLRARGDYSRSQALYERALQIREMVMGPTHPGVGRVLNQLAMTLEAEGLSTKALDAEIRAAGITERNLAVNLTFGSERQKLAYASLLAAQTNQILSTAMRSEDPRAGELAATVILQRKGRLLDVMSDTLSASRQRAGPEGQRFFDDWKDTAAQLARAILDGPSAPADTSSHSEKVAALERKREQLETAISRYTSGFLDSSRADLLAAVRSALPEESALLEFTVYQPLDPKSPLYNQEYGAPRYAVFALTRDSLRWMDLGSASEIEALVSRFRDSLRQGSGSDGSALARALCRKIILPLRSSLDGISRLLISPDGALNLVPFAALMDTAQTYLIQRYSISYLTSGRDLLRIRSARVQGAASRPLIVADPDFDAGPPRVATARSTRPSGTRQRSITTGASLAGVYFAPLPGTLREAREIAALFRQASVLTGPRAAEAALKSVSAPAILHIATHGFFLDDSSYNAPQPGGGPGTPLANPLIRSGLALAGANRRSAAGQDGILTALEASGLNLAGTKLVTLSACDTGIGAIRNGEGVYGFRRALVLAGAETLVMSLWPVSDTVTRELMTAYYTGLRRGEGRGDALRRVQLHMLKRSERRHPHYWASFIASGDWGSLDRQP